MLRVEERVTVRGRRGRDDVVEDPLDEVGVAGLPRREQQPPAEHDRRDAGAGLAVGAVRGKLPVVAERLALVPGPHPARDIGAAGDRGRPLVLQRLEQAVVVALDRDVDRGRRQIEGPHRVPAQHGRVAHGDVVLEVLAAEVDVAEGAVAAALEEELRLVEVALLAGEPGELGEPDLDAGMAADPVARVRAELMADMVGDPSPDRDQRVVETGGPAARDGRLQQMAVVVELVPPLEVGVALHLAGRGRSWC